ncbi:Uncharacterised protein [Vibrio cholerae]|nr:Uncharacterised protein [Vibrio cholerae]
MAKRMCYASLKDCYCVYHILVHHGLYLVRLCHNLNP